jgi:hypothetical protein
MRRISRASQSRNPNGKAAWGNHLLTLRQAAPGTFFALFGAAVISIGLVCGINIDQIRQLSRSTEQSPVTFTPYSAQK